MRIIESPRRKPYIVICTVCFLSLLFYFIIIFLAASIPQNEDEFDREDTKPEVTILTEDICTILPSSDDTGAPCGQSSSGEAQSPEHCMRNVVFDNELNANTQESRGVQNNDFSETLSITDTADVSNVSISHILSAYNAPPLFPPSTSEDILSSLPAVALAELQKPDDGLFPRKRKMEQHRVLSSGAVTAKQHRVICSGAVADHKR